MAKGLDAALGFLSVTLSALPGIKAAPKYAADSPRDFPFIWICPGAGNWQTISAGFLVGLLSIDIELHLKKADLQVTEQEAMKYAEAIPRAILTNPTLGETVTTIGDISVTRLQMMTFGEYKTVGFRWTINEINFS